LQVLGPITVSAIVEASNFKVGMRLRFGEQHSKTSLG